MGGVVTTKHQSTTDWREPRILEAIRAVVPKMQGGPIRWTGSSRSTLELRQRDQAGLVEGVVDARLFWAGRKRLISLFPGEGMDMGTLRDELQKAVRDHGVKVVIKGGDDGEAAALADEAAGVAQDDGVDVVQVNQGDGGDQEAAGELTDRQEGDHDMGESMDDMANEHFKTVGVLVKEQVIDAEAAGQKREAVEAVIEQLKVQAAAFAAKEEQAWQNVYELLLETPARRRQFGDQGDKAA